jgi:peptide/nickel transport system permease protein
LLRYFIQRLLFLIPLLLIISFISFLIIDLPPGSFLNTYEQRLRSSGVRVPEAELERLARMYGLDKPLPIRYYRWMRNIILDGNFGRSFVNNRPIRDILAERVPLTVLVSGLSMLFTWIIAVPIGIYSALKKYSVFDYIVTFFGFIGLALPSFLLALVLMWIVYVKTGWAITGFFSPGFEQAPWSIAKVIDLLKNIWLPLVVLGTGGTAGLIRTLRGTLLDELGKQYVTTARAKGMKEWKLILKYPVRVAINPLVSTIGWMLPALVGGEIIVSVVLNLRTVGPVLYDSIMAQDMYLAGSIIMILSTLTVVGTFLSDILLALLDPRIRYTS